MTGNVSSTATIVRYQWYC